MRERSSDEAPVRAYLRTVVGSPIAACDDSGSTEAGFVAVASRWAAQVGVDRRTLLAVGVPKATLDAAGVVQESSRDAVGRHYGDGEFTIAEVVARSCASPSSVRAAVAADEADGVLERVLPSGRSHRWRRSAR